MNRKRFNFDSIGEAFRAGNRARRKESVQDTVESVNDIQAQIEIFKQQTGIELVIKDGHPYYDNETMNKHSHCLNIIDNKKLTSLPHNLEIDNGHLDIYGCDNLTCLPSGLKVNGDLTISKCKKFTTVPADIEAESLYFDGCNSLTSLPDGLSVKWWLGIRRCRNLMSFPHNVKAHGVLLHKSRFKSLPSDLTVDPDGVIKEIPAGLLPFFKKNNIKYKYDSRYTFPIIFIEGKEWMTKRMMLSQTSEAFRAGNRARKKESVQDTIEQPYGPEKTIEDFYKITGYKLTYRDGWYEWGADMRLENRLFSDDNNCEGLKTLPSPLRIKSCLYLKWCKDLETLPDTLEIGGFLSIEYCPKLRSIGEHTKVYTDVYIRGCNSLDRLPLSLRFRRTMHLNDMSAGIVKDTPVITFVKSLGIEPGKWGSVDAAQWPGNKMDEAFKAGNRARKKESVQDTVESVDKLQQQIDLFKEQTGIELEIRDGYPYFDGNLRLIDCTGLTGLPDGLKVRGDLWLRNCTGLTSLPAGLEVRGGLNLRGCTGLTSLPDGLEVGGGLNLKGCTGLTSLPAGLEVGGNLSLEGCTGLTGLPAGLKVGECLNLRGCTGLTGLPFDLVVDGVWITHGDILKPFFRKLRIPVSREGDTKASDWRKWQKANGYLSEAFKAGNRARKKESVVDNTNKTDMRFPGTGIDAFDDYFRTVYPTPESIQDSNFTNPDDLRTFCNNARNLLKKQYSIVKEDMNMDPCRLDLDWFKWFRDKLREFPQFIWPSHDNITGSVRSITIPEGTEVLVMRLGVFERLETVRLPDSLKKINVDAFSECCHLKNVRFGGNLETIRTSAFYGCKSLGPIHIPASVRTIEFNAFEESGITEFVMDPDCQVEEIERNLCRLCTSLNRIELGNNVKWIKTLAFAFLGDVDEVVLPAGLSQGIIEKNAFKNTWIKTVYIKGDTEKYYDSVRGLNGFESIKQKVLEAINGYGGEPEFISIP